MVEGSHSITRIIGSYLQTGDIILLFLPLGMRTITHLMSDDPKIALLEYAPIDGGWPVLQHEERDYVDP